MPARRAKGTGGVRPYRRDGKLVGWRVEVKRSLPDGTLYRRTKTFLVGRRQTKTDAERWGREQLALLDAGRAAPSGTLAGWADEWMRSHRATAAASNWARDEQTLARHVLPRLGPLRLDAITSARVNAWLGDLHAAGVTSSERRRAFVTLKKMLRAHERVPRSIWDRVKPPRHRTAETRHLHPPELAALLAAAAETGPRHLAMVRVAVSCGLRAGELLGLQWGDYDPAAGRLSVRRSVCYRTGKLKDVKTDGSRRALPVGPATAAALAALPRGADDAPIFGATRGGGHYRYMNWFLHAWSPLVRRAGLKGRGIVPKSLRHTCASNLIAAGVNILIVSKRLGHSDPGLTLRVYSHLMPDDQDRAAAILDAAPAGGG